MPIMATISQLVEKFSKQPGDIQIFNWRQVDLTLWRRPFFTDENNYWVCRSPWGAISIQDPDCTTWLLWNEPVMEAIKLLKTAL